LGVHHEALHNSIRQDEADRGEREDRPTTDMLEENRRLHREVAELHRVKILKAPSAYFASELVDEACSRPPGAHISAKYWSANSRASAMTSSSSRKRRTHTD
jgi:transposase-like protein